MVHREQQLEAMKVFGVNLPRTVGGRDAVLTEDRERTSVGRLAAVVSRGAGAVAGDLTRER